MSDNIKNYATEAFRFYAAKNMTADKYKQRIYNEALKEYKRRQKSEGVSCPTESIIIQAENAVIEKLAEIQDMEAVEMTLAELRAGEKFGAVKAVMGIYFKDPDKELTREEIRSRVHEISLDLPASERQVYRMLSQARELFAVNRKLRIQNKNKELDNMLRNGIE